MLREKVNNERELKDYMYCHHWRGWNSDLTGHCAQSIHFLWCHDCPRNVEPGQGDNGKGGSDVV